MTDARRRLARRLAVRVLEISLCVVLPLLALVHVFSVVAGDGKATDFENAFYPAARAVVHGESPFPAVDDPVVSQGVAYVYPPLTAVALVPFTVLSAGTAGVLAMALLVLAVPATLLVLGVRDWRCYGLAFAWPPVFSAIQTANVTIVIALCLALAWRFRDAASRSGAALGVALALKLFAWPAALWLIASKRIAAAFASVGAALVLLAASWTAVGFAGLREYPDLLDRLEDVLGPESYTLYALALDVGAPSAFARLLWLALGVGLLAGVVFFARRGDDRRSFGLAIVAALACTPLVWLHYFALLLVVVAVMQPTLAPVWFVPLAMYFSTATHNGTTFQTIVTIAAAGLTAGLSLRPSAASQRRPVAAMSPAAEGP
jgi:hypothetical protein